LARRRSFCRRRRSGLGITLTALLVPPLLARIQAEETAAKFGAEYETYRARTSRLIPWRF
jgi:protein-S-isoprenylcysteine O-methyltransferase Ste14